MINSNNYSVLKDVQIGDIIQYRRKMRRPECDQVETAVVATKSVIPADDQNVRGTQVQISYVPSGLPDSFRGGHGYIVAGEFDDPAVWGKMEFQVVGKAAKAVYKTAAPFWYPAPGNRGYDLTH